MPPKKPPVLDKWTASKDNKCYGRDTTPLKAYFLNASMSRGYLASLLNKAGYLHLFDQDELGNECIFTYPGSDWFGIYLKDQDGQFFYDINPGASGDDSPGIFYFKIMPDTDGTPKIGPGSFVVPPELAGVKPCQVNSKGNCVNPGEEKSPASAKKKAATPAAAEPVVAVPKDTLSKAVEAMQINPATAKTKASEQATISRGQLEDMSAEDILAWVAKHMKPQDIIGCLGKKVFLQLYTPDEIARLSTLAAEVPGAVIGADETETAVAAAAQMGPNAVQRMFQKISKQDLIDQVNAVKDPNERKQAIVQLCQRAGLNVTSKLLPNGNIRIIGTEGQTMDADEALNGCASWSAIRARMLLTQRLRSPLKQFAREGRDEIWPTFAASSAPAPSAPAPRMTASQAQRTADIVDELKDMLANGEMDDFVAFVNNTGIFVDLRDDGMFVNGRLIEIDSEDMEDLIDNAALEYIKKFNVQFGSRCKKAGKRPIKIAKVKSNFKCAARKCKKSANYRVCMKKELRRIYSKRKNGVGCPCDKKASSFGKKKNLFIQEANARSRRKGTVGTFGRWCRRNNLDVNGKVSLRCINKAKKSGNTKLIRRAVYAQNIKAYAGAKKKRRVSFGKKKGKAVNSAAKHRNAMLFKKAAKKCKGSSDYRKCFTKTLRKMHKTSFGARTRPRVCKRLKKRSCRSNPQCRWSGRRKGEKVKHRCVRRRKVYEGPALPPRRHKTTSFGKRKLPQNKSQKFIYRKRSTHPKRKSPRVSATSVSVGTVKKGVDGNQWKVKKTKTGVKRWVKV